MPTKIPLHRASLVPRLNLSSTTEIPSLNLSRPITAASSTNVLLGLKEYRQKFLAAAMLNSWWPGVMLFFIAFCSEVARIGILKFMENFGPYAVAWFQLLNIGIATVVSLGFQACMKRNPAADLNQVPFEIFPGSAHVFKNRFNLPVGQAALFTSLNYAMFVSVGIIKGDGTENDSKLNSFMLRLSMDPSLLFMLNMAITLVGSGIVNGAVKGVQAIYGLCRRSNDEAGPEATPFANDPRSEAYTGISIN